jgi:hypothetical protein
MDSDHKLLLLIAIAASLVLMFFGFNSTPRE